MKIILMEDVPALGRRGEVREVATGYARNYLLPKKLALPATPGNLQNLEHLKRQRDRAENKAREAAQAAADRIAALELAVATRASEDGRLFGSVTTTDICEALESQLHVQLDRRKLHLDEPIKTLGVHEIPIRLHADVTVPITVEVISQ